MTNVYLGGPDEHRANTGNLLQLGGHITFEAPDSPECPCNDAVS